MVAVILVNYHSEEDTAGCLKSLQAVAAPETAVYVADNGSADPASFRETVLSFPHAQYLPQKENGGFSAGNNAAIRKALEDGAEYILLLNNDTVVSPEFLEKLLALAERKPKAGIVTGKILYHADPRRIWYAGGEVLFDRGSIIHCRYNEYLGPDEEEREEKARRITFATGCLMLIPAEVIRKVGLLSEEYFLYGEDSDYSLRVQKAGYEIWYEPAAMIWHKVGASSRGGSFLSQYYMVRNDFYVFDRYSPDGEKDRVRRRVIVRRLKDAVRGNIRFRALFKGYADYRRHVLGRAEEKVR